LYFHNLFNFTENNKCGFGAPSGRPPEPEPVCTVTLLFQVIPSHPIVLAGNRDEFLARGSTPPRVWAFPGDRGPVRILAGRDEEGGGTWFGINQHGVVAGLTNRYTGTRDPRKLSRGMLVLRCLSRDHAADAPEGVTTAESRQYNPFNLFCLTVASGFAATNFPAPRAFPLAAGGVYVFTNRQVGDPGDPKSGWIRKSLEGLPLTLESSQACLLKLLRAHPEEGLAEPLCVHLAGYGTVSSYFLAIGRSVGESRFLSSSGPPCTTPYQDLSEEFVEFLLPKTGPHRRG